MSRTVPTGARPEWPFEPERGQGHQGKRSVPGPGYGDRRGTPGPERGGQAYDRPSGYGNQGYGGQAQNSRTSGAPRYDGKERDGLVYPEQGGYDRQRRNPRQGYRGQQPGDPGRNGRGNAAQGNGDQGYGRPARGYPDQSARQYDSQGNRRRSPGRGYAGQSHNGPGSGDQPTQSYGHQGATEARGLPARHGPGRPGSGLPGSGRPGSGLLGSGRFGSGRSRPGQSGPGQPGPGQGEPKKVRFHRLRRLARLRTVRAISAVVAVLLVWVMFSAGQAAFKNNGQGFSANLAEWARGHYLGPIVTFGEWLSYNPPKVGGKPGFSLAIPQGQQVGTSRGKHKGFQPDIPATLKSLAGGSVPGEGQWRVVEKVHGQPAIFTTFLRDATYTSYVNGIASMDQRLVKFQMHPGSEDPGPGNWGAWGSTYIPPGMRTGLLATFNGGFKLDSSQGGFYLNGQYHGSLVNGAASVVYYKNGTIKIGVWGRDFTMNSSIEGVRQNLKPLIDHGKIAPNLNQNVQTKFGATLGGGYYVWRSGLGITKDGRIVYVYGPALNVQDLAELLARAGAVEGMQMDINPYWMKYEYYTANGHPSNPQPTNLLPTQQQSAYTYYSPYTRDFTAVYAR
jgi:hypothetical protein